MSLICDFGFYKLCLSLFKILLIFCFDKNETRKNKIY